ncbi:TolC family protein [Desulfuromonas carbonis]|uniref:TolC family protein n=1 Tax=Desulfuromonas sp. DDH964 TaxID=1823759 RepID=UPI00078D428A|nr:TolC family protein [Desulfuromonas sp. DDH964]AMV73931.1 RND family efflux pump outer membrane protein [Desulfuromonas sp. DDH964]
MQNTLMCLMLLPLLLVTGLGHAESVDLQEALAAAVAQRPLAEVARQQAAGARAAVTEARSGYLPHLNLKESYQATNEPGGSLFISLNQERLVLSPTADPYNHPETRHDFETRLTLEQSLYNPDVGYGLDRAEAGYRAATALAGWTEEQVAFAAFAAYLEVQQAQAGLAAVESSLAEVRETVRLAKEREENGLGLRSDTLQARVRLAEAERLRMSTANDLQLARRRLALAIGRDGGEVGIARPLVVADLPVAADSVPQPRGDLQAALAEAKAAELARRQSRAGYLPRLGVTASYAWHDPEIPFGSEAQSWQVGAGLTWELFDGLRRSGSIERTAAQQRAARLQAEELRRAVALQTREAELRANEAQLQRDSAQAAVAAAEESQRLLLQRYENGLSPLSDLLASQAALDQARSVLVRASGQMLLARGNVQLQKGLFLKMMLPGKEVQR